MITTQIKHGISIIVPVYKVEDYIGRCLESIIAQTFTDWECILVDDGSPDRSGNFCDEYAAKEKRFKVIHKSNGGVSSARNAGLKEAANEWICFLDSDDYWDSDFLMNFVPHLEDDVDLYMQGYRQINEQGLALSINVLPNLMFQNGASVVAFLEMKKGFHNGFLWHRLFRKSIFRSKNISFPEGISYAEDGCVFLQYVQYINKAKTISECGYNYRITPNSLTNTFSKLDDSIFKYLIETYLNNINKLTLIDSTDRKLVDSLRIYSWRLLMSWVVARSLSSEMQYKQSIIYAKQLINEYSLFDIHKTTIVHRLLMFFCNYPGIPFSRKILSVLIRVRNREL